MINAQAAEIERLEALVVSRVRASADAIVEIASQAAEIERLRVRVAELDDGGYAAQRAAVAELTVKDQAAEIAMLQSIIDVLDEHNVASAVRAALRGDRP